MTESWNMPGSELTLFTIGHSNLPIDRIIELLKTQEIEILVDVRSSPYSKYNPQFNQDQFQWSIEKAGLHYKFAGDYLGGRPKDPECYKDRQIPEVNADYLHLVDYPTVMTKAFFQTGINDLIGFASKWRVAILCSEEDPAKCHRHHLIGRYLVDRGFSVLHIRSDGNLIKDELLPTLSDEPSPKQLSLFEE